MSGAGQGVLTSRYNSPHSALPMGAAATRMLGVPSAATVRPAIPIRGGKRKSRRGGFYPAVMGPMARTGIYLLPPAIKNAYSLLTRKRKGRKGRKGRKTKGKRQ